MVGMSTRPNGPITTLLDLTNRDLHENYMYPLDTKTTWFTRNPDRATITFTPQIQTLLYRGPAAFGQKFTFELGPLEVGDILFGTVLQLQLGHWLDATTILQLAAGVVDYTDPQTAWEYANSLGSICIAKADLEIDGVTVESIDGDWIHVFSLLWSDYNTQVGVAYNAIGRIPISTLRTIAAPEPSPPRSKPLLIPTPRTYPTEDGYIHCPLPFFFGRSKYQEGLPLIAVREGLVRISITLRPFTEVVRQIRGYRDSCTATPLATQISFTKGAVTTDNAIPEFKSAALLTHGAVIDGEIRAKMLKDPFEMLRRDLQTFWFEEPLKYSINKQSDTDTVTVQLPLEANGPIEEIIWFIRRKGVGANNEWTNFSDQVEADWPVKLTDPIGIEPTFLTRPLLQTARIQINGSTIVEAEEQYFRQHIAAKHRGGFAAFSNFIYGWSFAESPGQHQPTGSINASRTNSLRLTLEVRSPPARDTWEVKVFCMGINWLRFQNGLANAVFTD